MLSIVKRVHRRHRYTRGHSSKVLVIVFCRFSEISVGVIEVTAQHSARIGIIIELILNNGIGIVTDRYALRRAQGCGNVVD